MHTIMDLCFLCTKDYNCVPVDNKIVTQVEYVLPEITIFKLGIPLRICSVCDGALYAFSKFKQYYVESSRRLEANIKGVQGPPLHTDNTHVVDSQPYNTKHSKPQHGSGTTTQITQPSLHTDKTSKQDQEFYNTRTVQNSSELECTKNKSEGQLSAFNSFKQIYENSSQEMGALDPLLQTDNNETSNNNPENIEEIFIKEEQIEESSEDMEYSNTILQKALQVEYNTNNLVDNNSTDGSTRAEETIDEDWAGSSFCEEGALKYTKTKDDTASLPEKSKSIYIKVYTAFKKWCLTKKVTKIDESVMLVYFEEQAVHKKASSLWAKYSMLKSTLLLKENVDMSKYSKLLKYLKRQNATYKPKKSSVFSKEEIIKFLKDAPDEAFLSTKAIFVIGLAGACRTDELCNLHMEDINILDDIIIVSIQKNKNGFCRKFVLAEPLWIQIVKKYLSMRPSPDMPRVFIGFRQGKPTRQNIGHNTISRVPNTVATYLKLPNAQNFTGHSLRRTSAIILGENKGDILTLKRQVSEGYGMGSGVPTALSWPNVPSTTSDVAMPSTSFSFRQ